MGMEADWELEIGPGAPLIDAAWTGLVDLRSEPGRVNEIGETARLPGLAQALLRMNSSDSPVWTTKCDVWQPDSVDPDEMEASRAEGVLALACYIDMLPRFCADWASPARVENFCRRLVGMLRSVQAFCCRADLVVRQTVLRGERPTLGITAYLAGCGTSNDDAVKALTNALSAFADLLSVVPPVQESEEKLQ